MNGFYKDAEKVDFTVMGIFPMTRPELVDRYRTEFLGYINSANPLTEEIYNHPDFKERRSEVRGTAIFSMTNGQYLNLISGGKAQKALSAITKKYRAVAAQLAREARKANGWKDDGSGKYRITPDGKRTTSNGMKINKYAMPWSVDDGGDFDGIITDKVKFTK